VFVKTILLLIFMFLPSALFAMHIMEGFLPPVWAGVYWVLCLPFMAAGLRNIKKISGQNNKVKLLLAMAGAFTFVVSALKLPSLTGSSSHPTGIALGTILFGPSTMTVLGFIVLLFQALLLAHGGLTTLGANAVSMAVIGPFVAWGIWILGKKAGLNRKVTIFLAAFFSDILTYLSTSLQLALAHPDSVSGVMGSFVQFMGVFAVTQLPLALIEGLLTVVILNVLMPTVEEELKEFRGGLL